ncbi:oligosaccharide flippase family protein [Motilimonas sp. KMU-193]|uniref:oligosaccharide flippase family protein n=1 Tax=Motilimonas sp. KMU-193 TaxID=3388668 RepID=UPI00396B1CFA
MLKGIGSTFIASGYVALSQIILLAFSARYLSSIELGWISIGGAIIAFSNVFIDSGIGTYIIYRRDLKRKELNSLLLCSFILAVASFSFIYFFANNIESFFSSPGLGEILKLYALLLLLSPFMSQFQALLVLEQKLGKLGLIDVITKTAGVGLSVVMLVLNFGISAIIAGLLLSTFLKSIFMHLSLKDDFKANCNGFEWSIVPFAWNYCRFQIGGQLLNFARMYVDTIIIGKVFDVSQLGVYSLAKELVGKIPALLSPIYGKIVFPAMTRVKENKNLRSELFSGVNLIVVYINAIIFSMMAIFSDSIVMLLYGGGEDVMVYIKILCIFFMIRGGGIVNGFFLQSLGKVRREFYWNLFSSIMFSTCIYFFSMNGMLYMLWGMVSVQVVFLVLSFFIFHYPSYPIKVSKYLAYTFSILISGSVFIFAEVLYEFEIELYLSIISAMLTLLFTTFLVYHLLGGKNALINLRDIYIGAKPN